MTSPNLCVALYDFPGETVEDLRFSQGDTIVVLETLGADWMRGSLNGEQGESVIVSQ